MMLPTAWTLARKPAQLCPATGGCACGVYYPGSEDEETRLASGAKHHGGVLASGYRRADLRVGAGELVPIKFGRAEAHILRRLDEPGAPKQDTRNGSLPVKL